MADRTGEYRIIAFAQRQVNLTDWIFTFGGVLILLIAAFAMVADMGDEIMETVYETRWLNWGYWLVMGILATVIPLVNIYWMVEKA